MIQIVHYNIATGHREVLECDPHNGDTAKEIIVRLLSEDHSGMSVYYELDTPVARLMDVIEDVATEIRDTVDE